MIKVGIIGGAGYTAGELIRLLINHPDAEIKFVHSNSHAGHKLTEVHEGLYGETDLAFTDAEADPGKDHEASAIRRREGLYDSIKLEKAHSAPPLPPCAICAIRFLPQGIL